MKCKLNDLCFVIKSETVANIGKVVTCKKYLGRLPMGRNYFNMNFLDVKDAAKEYWIVTGNLVNNIGTQFNFGLYGDNDLLPIPTEPVEDFEISSKELEFN